jgi:hypothetical protein
MTELKILTVISSTEAIRYPRKVSSPALRSGDITGLPSWSSGGIRHVLRSSRPSSRSGRRPARAWRTLGLVVLRCYLLAAIIVLAVRAVQLALDAAR